MAMHPFARLLRRQGMRARNVPVRLAALLFGAALVLATPAYAHMGQSKTVRIQSTPEGAQLRVELPLLDAAVGLGLGAHPKSEELLRQSAVLETWLATRLLVRNDKGACTVAHQQTTLHPPTLAISLSYRCEGSPNNLALRDTSLEDHEDHESIVIFGGEPAAILRDGRKWLELAPPSAAEIFLTFLNEGFVHLLTGYDHILFIVTLLLALGLSRGPLRAPLREAAMLVTSFTLGHSLTLVAAALDWLQLPIGPVEAAIALSIVVAALLNLTKKSLAPGLRPGMAFGFGLVHGLGFSSVLSELGLPRTHELLGLFAFNIGIELGQLAFVLALTIPLIHLGRRHWYRPVVLSGGSIAIALVGTSWFIDRAGLI